MGCEKLLSETAFVFFLKVPMPCVILLLSFHDQSINFIAGALDVVHELPASLLLPFTSS
jgi:hypothetical protein